LPIEGATGAEYVIASPGFEHLGRYDVVVSNVGGSVTSATVAIRMAPVVLEQPQDLTADEGGTAGFSVKATGYGTLTYQWYKGGVAIVGATGTVYSKAGVKPVDAGDYKVRVTNTAGFVESAVAKLTVVAAPTPTAPVIVTQPVGMEVEFNQPANFSVVATGYGTLTYQWKKGGVNIVGATLPTYGFAKVATANAGTYTVEVKNSVGAVVSAGAVLSIVGSPKIESEPVEVFALLGGKASFGVEASGLAPMTYQWWKGASGVATTSTVMVGEVVNLVKGTKTNALAFEKLVEADFTVYRADATNLAGKASSREVRLWKVVKPTIKTQPLASVVRMVGGQLALTVEVNAQVAPASNGTLSYQWYKGTEALSGQTAATLTLTGLELASAGDYKVRVSNAAGFVDSVVSKVRVCEAIVVQPLSGGGAVFVGKPFTLTAAAGPVGTGPFRYQWMFNGKDLLRANGTTYSVAAAAFAQGGMYSVRVNAVDARGLVLADVPPVVSEAVEVKVVEAPVVVTQPVSRYVAMGMAHTVSATVRGTAPMSYQWYRKLKGTSGAGEAIAGATASSYTLPLMVKDVDGANPVAGDYWVQARNEYGEVTTEVARLWEGGPEILSLTDLAGALPGPARTGGTLVFRAVVKCVGSLTLGWQRNGVALEHNMNPAALDPTGAAGSGTTPDVVSIVNQEIGEPGEGLWESVLTVTRVTTTVSSGKYAVVATETVSKIGAQREIGPVSISGTADPQTITFGAVNNRKAGDGPFDLSASSTSFLPVSFEILSGGEIVSLGGTNGRTVSLKPGKTGVVMIQATQEGNARFSRAKPVERAFFVMPADYSAYRKLTASRHRASDDATNYASHVLGIRFDGTLWAWGLNDAGQTGTGGEAVVVTPQPVGPERTWLDVSAGEQFTVAISTDGTLWGWGANGTGQLGNGSGIGSALPMQVSEMTGWVSVSAGRAHAVGIRVNEEGVRELWAWGANGSGQIGDGTTEARFSPVRVGAATDHWLQASAGDQHSMGIRARVVGGTTGELLTWGNNSKGQLGKGGGADSAVPVVIGTDNWASVDAGVLASAAIHATGKLYTWGFSDSGKLGHGTAGESILVPKLVASIQAQLFKSVSFGRSHVVALTQAGALWAWGNNVHNQCGTLDTNQYAPTQIPAYSASVRWMIGVGGNAQSVLASNTMTLAAIGYANNGELGLGFLKSTWLAASGGKAAPGPRFEVTMAPPPKVEVRPDGSLSVVVAMIQPSSLNNPVATWTADGGTVSAFNARTAVYTNATEPGLLMADGSKFVVYALTIPGGPDGARLPREFGFKVTGTISIGKLGSSQVLDFPFPAIPVR
jgi:alpha-tubulin suppressor-like RCC1 family protein